MNFIRNFMYKIKNNQISIKYINQCMTSEILILSFLSMLKESCGLLINLLDYKSENALQNFLTNDCYTHLDFAKVSLPRSTRTFSSAVLCKLCTMTGQLRILGNILRLTSPFPLLARNVVIASVITTQPSSSCILLLIVSLSIDSNFNSFSKLYCKNILGPKLNWPYLLEFPKNLLLGIFT